MTLYDLEALQEENRLLTTSLAKVSADLADRENEVARTRAVLLELYNAVRAYQTHVPRPLAAAPEERLVKAKQAAAALFEETA